MAKARNMSVTFLGTSSGGGPVVNRNCSSLVLNIAGDGSLWLVDCAEGTLRQFLLQPGPTPLRVNQVNKIFITHMHFDHCMGLITLLANLLRGSAGTPTVPLSKPPAMNLYGPAGLRKFVRSILNMTATTLTERYTVHELLSAEDERTSCDLEDLHLGESPGSDILCDKATGRWEGFLCAAGLNVSAASVSHRVPCLGYVFSEVPTPPLSSSLTRKIVILGDTSDPSPVLPLAHDADLLVHEATDAYIPVEIDRGLGGARKTLDIVKEKTIAKGHSTPCMAGMVAKRCRARMLVMNHFSAKFPAPAFARDRRHLIMAEIERQASQAWGMGKAIAAHDFLKIDIPAKVPEMSAAVNGRASSSKDAHDETETDENDSDESQSGASAEDRPGSCRSKRSQFAYHANSPYAQTPQVTTFHGKTSRGGGASPYPYYSRGRGRGIRGASDAHRRGYRGRGSRPHRDDARFD